ncbi:MAG TPA: hypothetical protein VFW98_07225, partial [Gemmatimonadaceae bacterium]|nr:hypothetical protein [Gemmatimonadaceae bacterium]
LSRGGTPAEHGLISDAEWRRVERLRQELGWVRAGAAAPEFAARVEQDVAGEFTDPAALSIFARLVDADVSRCRAAR